MSAQRLGLPPWFPPALAARNWQAIIVAGSAGGVDALLKILPGLPVGMQLPVAPEHQAQA